MSVSVEPSVLLSRMLGSISSPVTTDDTPYARRTIGFLSHSEREVAYGLASRRRNVGPSDCTCTHGSDAEGIELEIPEEEEEEEG